MTGAVLDHLWQTTAFGLGVLLLSLAFRRTQARVRFWLWAAASLKFLVPLSALVWVGSHLGYSAASPATIGWSFVIDDVSRPFTQPPLFIASRRLRAAAGAGLEDWLMWVWAAGAMVVAGQWCVRWVRLRRRLQGVEAATGGPAEELLEQLRGRIGVGPVRLVRTEGAMEPGVFGIFRPMLVLPAGIESRLSEEQLAAILGHELWHVKRRDNLTAALQMAVQSLFWFHPLVWWLGARLAAERERACDEAVVAMLETPRVYAQGILKVCEFYVEASMPCVAGVTGADLRKRIEDIMTQRVGVPLNFSRRALLAAAAALAIGGPLAVGVLNAPAAKAQTAGGKKQFEVASIKPMDPAMGGMHRVEIGMSPGGRFRASGVTLRMLMQQAYGVRDFQLVGLPAWATTDRYEINAKGEGDDIRREDIRPMLQSLLEERFQMKLRRETKEGAVYNLVVAKGGLKMKESEAGMGDQMRMGRGMVQAQGASMEAITNSLANRLGRAVVDQTGLKGRYDFKLEWTPDESENAMIRQMHPDAPPAPPLDSAGPSIFTALQEQLGLKLENAKGRVEMLVVEKVEKPSEN